MNLKADIEQNVLLVMNLVHLTHSKVDNDVQDGTYLNDNESSHSMALLPADRNVALEIPSITRH